MTSHSIAIAVHAIPTLLWCVIAYECGVVRLRHSRTTLFLLLALVSGFFAAHMVLHLVEEMLAAAGGPLARAPAAVRFTTAAFMIGTAPPMCHAMRLLPIRPQRPSRAWLVANYGSGALVLALYAAMLFAPPPLGGRPFEQSDFVAYGYVVVAFTVSLVGARREARHGAWLQGLGIAQLRAPETTLLAVTLLVAVAMLVVSWSSGVTSLGTSGALFLHTVVALLFAAPFAVRMLGRVARDFLLCAAILVAAAALLAGAAALRAAVTSPELRGAADVAAFLLLAAILVPGRAWARSAIERLLFRRSLERGSELQRVAAALSPAAGIDAVCRKAVESLASVMGFSGCAILLTRGRGAYAAGAIDVSRLAAIWPVDRAVDELPLRAVMEVELRDLPDELRAAAAAADVSRLAPIASPRRRWGHLLVLEGLLSPPIDEAELEALAAFLNQLALVLDGCELLERAVAVERSLAHAEKLAAIGELSARVAHEIRNPVTAARSLAQLMARDPGSPHAADDARLILTELERVERQIASLLRFARREEYRFAEADVAALVRSALADLRPALDDAGVAVEVDLDGPIPARVDAEKLRQVVVNLVENARDALAASAGERRVHVAARRENGAAHLRVADSGPGIPAEALGRLFEPFFSLKPSGTGLGLAIVKRTIEAHGGHIAVENAATGGAVFAIDLPLGRGE